MLSLLMVCRDEQRTAPGPPRSPFTRIIANSRSIGLTFMTPCAEVAKDHRAKRLRKIAGQVKSRASLPAVPSWRERLVIESSVMQGYARSSGTKQLQIDTTVLIC